jgi:hypothetical protein
VHSIIVWLVIVGALALSRIVLLWLQKRSDGFANLVTAAVGESDELRPTGEVRSNGMAWWVIGALFLVSAFAFLEFRQPYYFAQDDALVAEMPGMLEGCRSVWMGVWPDYDPYRLMGGPLAGTGLYSLTYPPTYLAYAVARDVLRNEYALLDVFAALHLAAGYCIMTCLCRRLGMRPMIGCCATLSFLLSGSILIMGRSWHAFMPIVVWMPLLMLAIQRLVERPVDWKWQVGTGVAAGLPFHVGFPQVWVYTVLFVALAIVLLWITGAISWRRMLSAWPAGFVTLGVVAPLLWPQLLASRNLLRPPPYGTGITSQWIAALLPYPLVKVAHPMGWGSTDVQYMGHFIYFGTVFAILFAVGALLILSRSSRKAWSRNVWLACAMIAMLIAIGDQGLLFYLMSKLPFTGTVNNNPFRALPFFVLFAVVAGGVVIERILRKSSAGARWAGVIPVITLVLLGYHVVMARPSFYTYGFTPFPALGPAIAKRIEGNTSARMISWTTRRSISPAFASSLPLDLPMVHETPAFSGYDPLLEWGESYRRAERLLGEKPVEALRMYGVRWHLLSSLLHNRVISPNPEVNAEERSIKDDVALQAVMPLLHMTAHTNDVRLEELADVSPMAFPETQPTLPLPIGAGGNGIKVSLKHWKDGGKIVVNFLWYPQMRAVVDGEAVKVSHDTWGRMVVDVPAGTTSLRIHYAAGWMRGLLAGLVLIAIGLIGSWAGGIDGPGLKHVDIHTPN